MNNLFDTFIYEQLQLILCNTNFFLVFIAVNLALNPLNMDIVFDGDMATHRSISAATLNLNGMFIVSAFIIHTSMKKKLNHNLKKSIVLLL